MTLAIKIWGQYFFFERNDYFFQQELCNKCIEIESNDFYIVSNYFYNILSTCPEKYVSQFPQKY